MTETVDLKSRKNRIDSLFSESECLHEESLLKVCKIDQESIRNIQSAVKFYVWDCLISSGNQGIKLDDSFFLINEEKIKNLPNITPNGLLVPKKENLLSFNKLQKIAFEEFKKVNINNKIDRVQFPINVRVQSGSFDLDSRARASSKIHTDIWAGDPASAITVFLHIYGDYKNIGIKFFAPQVFPKDQIKTLSDYNDGNIKTKDMKELTARYDDRGWIFIDPFILHQTYKESNSLRISLDFRFIPKELVESDTFENENRKPYFISMKECMSFGENKLLSTNQKLFGEYSNNKFTKSYPVDVFTADISENPQNNILNNEKFIGKNYLMEKFSISEEFLKNILENDFKVLKYRNVNQQERDGIINSIIDKTNSDSLRISGSNNNDVWEKGWGEILNKIKDKYDPEKLMPQYFDHHKIMRLDGDYINEISDNFVYKYDQIIKKIIIKKYANNSSNLIELGCGTGNGTLLACKVLDKSVKITASDWSENAVQILKEIAKNEKREITATRFNMLNLEGWDDLNIKSDSTIISFHALEQLGNKYHLLLNNLQKKKCLCVHLEPIQEFYNNNNLFDNLARQYHKKRNYLGKYLTDIENLEIKKKAKIFEKTRIHFGDRFHEAYGLVVWKGL